MDWRGNVIKELLYTNGEDQNIKMSVNEIKNT